MVEPPTRIRPEARFRVPQSVVYREFPAQMVLLHLDRGEYHGLNHTAGRMFAALESSRSVAAAAKVVATEMNMSIAVVEEDLCVLCASLLERGLIEYADDDRTRPANAG
jgi:hypothetical protein